jgi:hypothetical protein
VGTATIVNFDPLVKALGRESLLVVRSDDELASQVAAETKVQAEKNDVYAYGKAPKPVSMGKPLTTSPAQVLHELGVATTLITASPMAQVARHWAHVRYCATLRSNRQHLALTRVADDVVHHHATTQSEQLGIGLALVVARAVLRQQHPGWDFDAVDAEVALKAGFIGDVGEIDQATGTKKRPDYFLVGRRVRERRTGFKVVVLECKGSHQTPRFSIEQLARATVQVEAVRVGGRTPPSLMVASHLTHRRITSYVLDPEGEDDLWGGATQDMDEFLAEEPTEYHWHARPSPPASETPTEAAGADPVHVRGPEQEAAPRSDLQVFNIPEQRRGWFTQILARAAAATTLLFAGDSLAARGYATPRQRGYEAPPHPTLFEDADPPWAYSTARTLRLPGMRLEGTRFRTPLPDGRNLEVFRGVDARLHRMLADGRIGPYLRAAPGTFERWTRLPRLDGAAVSFGRDGTALVIRLTSGR